jgi:hypothetical protein
MAKKSSVAVGGQDGAGLTSEIEVVTSVDQGKPGNRIAVVTEILVFVDGRLVKVKRGHVRTVDVAVGNDKPAKPAQ